MHIVTKRNCFQNRNWVLVCILIFLEILFLVMATMFYNKILFFTNLIFLYFYPSSLISGDVNIDVVEDEDYGDVLLEE